MSSTAKTSPSVDKPKELEDCKPSTCITFRCDHYLFYLPHRLPTGAERECDREGDCNASMLVRDTWMLVMDPKESTCKCSQSCLASETRINAVCVRIANICMSLHLVVLCRPRASTSTEKDAENANGQVSQASNVTEWYIYDRSTETAAEATAHEARDKAPRKCRQSTGFEILVFTKVERART